MKKLRNPRRVVSQEQPAILETSTFAEQQAQAKSGVITAPSGSNAVIKATAAAEPAVKTLADTMRDALAAADDEQIAIINLANRTVTLVPAGTSVAAITGASGLEQAAELTMDDPTKASGPMSNGVTEGTDSTSISNIVASAKPSFSVPTVVNRIEDAVAEISGRSGLVVVDQANATVEVFTGTTANVEAVDAATLTEEAHFVQTLAVAGGRQFGE